MNWLSFNTLIVILLGFTPVFAAGSEAFVAPRACVASLDAPADPKQEYLKRIDALKNEILKTDLLHRTYSVHEAIALVSSYLPTETSAKFIGDSWARLSKLEIIGKDARPGMARLRYRTRFLDWRVDRRDAARIVWSNAKIESQVDLETLIESTINIFAEAGFVPVRRHSILLRPARAFFSDNIEVIKEKILLKLFALGEDSAAPAPGIVQKTLAGTWSVLRGLLPIHFGAIRSVQFNQEQIDAFKAGGAEGLYRHLKYRHGIGLAVRYWFNHLTNAKFAIVMIYAAVLAPSALDSWQYFSDLQSFQAVDDTQYELARRLYESLQTPPAELLTSIEEHIGELDPADQETIRNALKE